MSVNLFKYFGKLFRRLSLANDLVEKVYVSCECFSSNGRQGAGRERPIILIGLGDGNVTGFLKRANMRCQIPIGHFKRCAHFGERKFR